MTADSSALPQPPHSPHLSHVTPVPGEDIRWTTAKALLGWASTQNPLVVLCLLMLGLAGYMAHYSINTAIPAHLESIQKGYETIQHEHAKERERADREHRQHYETLATQMQQTAKEIRDVTKSQETLIREFLLPAGRRPAGVGSPREAE